MRRLLTIPQAPETSLYGHIGKFAGNQVAQAYEEMGGLPRFVAWAEKNPDEFYTKVFPKIIAKPVEHTVSDGVESLLDRLDAADRRVAADDANATDAEYEEISDDA